MKEKVLVTGGTGFIGPYLIKELAKQGYKCTCLIRDKDKAKDLEKLKVKIVVGDITKPETLKDITKDIDFVYHLATLGHSEESKIKYETYYKINVEGTKNIAEECLRNKVKKFVYFTTTAALGTIKKEIIDDEVKGNPQTSYGKTKKLAEELLKKYCKEKKLPVVTIRLSMVYGPRDKRDLLTLCRLVKKSMFIKIGFGKNITPAAYIDDIVNGVILAMKKGRIGEIYNLTGEYSPDYNYMRKLILKNLGIKRPYLWVPKFVAVIGAILIENISKIMHVKPLITYRNIQNITSNRILNIEKAKKELGYQPKITIEEGIKRTVEWYKKNNLI